LLRVPCRARSRDEPETRVGARTFLEGAGVHQSHVNARDRGPVGQVADRGKHRLAMLDARAETGP
jgi:hypothetical protein